MKFRLINTKTNEEALCEKVTIGSFDYYVSDEKVKEGGYFYHRISRTIEKAIHVHDTTHPYPKVIATTNSNIDIPQIVDEARELAKKEHYDGTIEGGYLVGGFINGYNKAKETYQFTKEDMINFAWWLKENIGRYSCDRIAHFEGRYFQTWKEQQPKTLYYNE